MRYIFLLVILIFQSISYAQDCPEGDFELTTQQQVDEFPSLYPDCDSLTGSLKIISSAADPIIALDNLISIKIVNGSLIISDNEFLSDLDGLSNIENVDDALRVINNKELVDLEGLNGIKKISKALEITDNEGLTSLHGLEGIDTISRELLIYNNDALINLLGLDNLKYVEGFFQIFENDNLVNFEGMNSVHTIHDHFLIKANRKLQSFQGFDNLEYISGMMQFADNDKLEKFNGFNKLSKIGESINLLGGYFKNLEGLEFLDTINGLQILDEDELTSLKALENVEFIRHGLSLRRLEQLESLEGLENVTAVDGYIRIQQNKALADLRALSNVENIDGQLWVEFNSSLESLNGLHNIDPNTIHINPFYNGSDLNIKSNENLMVCNLGNLCAFVSKQIGDFDIDDNAGSCLDEDEFIEHCISVSTASTEMAHPTVYPNPFNNYLTIEIANEDFLTITDLQGMRWVAQKLIAGKNTINLRAMASGIYFVNTVHSGRFKIIKL